MTAYGRAANLWEELHDPAAGTAYCNRSGSLLNLEKVEEAAQDLERAMRIAEGIELPQLTALCMLQRARLLWATEGATPKEIARLLISARDAFAAIGDFEQVKRVNRILEDVEPYLQSASEEARE